MTNARRIIAPLTLPLLLVAGFITLVILNDTAREVTRDALVLVFSIFSTPFIFEISCALLMLLALFLINQWRLNKEGDGWVYLMTHEPDAKNLPPSITQRLQSVVLPEKPEPVNEAQTANSVIEGYLELGMPAQGLHELNAESGAMEDAATTALRIRLLAANLDTDAALTLLKESITRHRDARETLAGACLESARWVLKYLQREDLARRWLAEATALDADIANWIQPGEPLRKLI